MSGSGGTLELGSGRLAVLACAVFVLGGAALFQTGPYAQLSAAAGALPEESITSAAELQAFLSALSAEQRALYLRWQLWDALNPLLIGFLGVAVLAWLAGRDTLASKGRGLLVIPLLAPAADLVENTVLASAVRAFPESGPLAAALPTVSALKFFALGATLLVALGLAARRLWRTRA